MFAAGLWIYSRVSHADDKVGKYGLGSFVVFLVVAYAAMRSVRRRRAS